jgi:prophage antirepressor-like protein
VINCEVNHMSDSSTTKNIVIPFNFESRELRTLLIDDQPWFVAADVAASLGYPAAAQMTRNLDEDEKGMQNVHTPGGAQEMLVINESGLYSAILRSRKSEAKRFKKWVTAEVLPAIRKHGRYEDAAGTMNKLCGALGLERFRELKRSKVSFLPNELQRKAMARIGQDLNIAFGVRSAADIPADKIEAACTFIAAYALEGEWLAKEPEPANLIDFRCSIEDWIARNPMSFGVTKRRGGDLSVTVGDLVLANDSPCLELLDKMHNAGYQVEGAFYEFRSYQNLMRQMDYLMKAAGGAISQALGTLERGRMKPQEYAGVQAVAA